MRTTMLHDASTPPLPQERRTRGMRSISAATISRYSLPPISSNGRIITIPPPPPPMVPPPPPPRIINTPYPATIRSSSQSVTLLSQSTTETVPTLPPLPNKSISLSPYGRTHSHQYNSHQYNKYTTYHHHQHQHQHNMHGMNGMTPRNQHFYANYGYPKCHSTKSCKNKRFFGHKYPPPTPPPRSPRAPNNNNKNNHNHNHNISQTPKPTKKQKIMWNDKELQQKQKKQNNNSHKTHHLKNSQSVSSLLDNKGNKGNIKRNKGNKGNNKGSKGNDIMFYVTMNGILTYSVIYDTNICGLELYPFDTIKTSGAVIIKCHNLYSSSRVICNSLLIGIGDKIVINMNYNKILKTIRFAQRPLKLTFHPPPNYIDHNKQHLNIKNNNNLTLWLGIDNNIHFESKQFI